MRRLLDWPRDHRISSMEPLSGPRSIGSGSSAGMTGYMQTFASPFGLWRWQFSFTPMKGDAFRRHRGLVMALHGGANAVRVPFVDGDIMSWEQSGVSGQINSIWAGQTWSNGERWSNGMNWRTGRPVVPLALPSAQGYDEIALTDTAWGHGLGIGDMIGFAPFHFGLYYVTEVISAGRYRIWPPLRRAVAAADLATLKPVLAMRLENESGANAARGTLIADSLTMTLVEIEDADLRAYYA